ncbi:hypothetical protein NliqN6_4154 [Naganishia liquefaciens]|uniref:Uncharacterized protein n=1 Tax=Naganishia liquefaciens TaxID=104408 RepID=A0A8H3TV70_9TREE|nr:hypothetical protein NliqN6_4154 [Naganishia liquefaciens]
MVRFKNRWLLVELLFPAQYASNASAPDVLALRPPGLDQDAVDVDNDQILASQDSEDADDPTILPLSFYTSGTTPAQPFLTPTKPVVISSTHSIPTNTQTSTPGAVVQNNQIWQAVRDSVMDVCGDVGWGKVASSLQVKYYSPTTSLCIIRVAREHVRTAWTGLTFVNEIGGQPVIPRVVAVSGTIKKLHFAAIRYSREITALYLAHTLRTLESDALRKTETDAWKARRQQVEAELLALDDA